MGHGLFVPNLYVFRSPWPFCLGEYLYAKVYVSSSNQQREITEMSRPYPIKRWNPISSLSSFPADAYFAT